MIPNTNDGSGRPPRLRCYLSELALVNMPVPGRGSGSESTLEAIHAAGYEGVQADVGGEQALLEPCRSIGLTVAGSGRVNLPHEADAFAMRMADAGLPCATLHLGWGLEDDAVARHLIEAVLTSSQKHHLPLYVETHRATVFQDMWRTVQFVKWYPELRFNGDFSHWYTGQEMVYGGFENKLAFIAPVLERVRFLHGRIGNPGCIQVDIGDSSSKERPSVEHFRELWTASMRGFLQTAGPGDYLTFVPELLAANIYYARVFPGAHGQLVEEGDRWRQSLLLCQIARECFAAASTSTPGR